MKHAYFKIPGWFNYSETYDIIVDAIPEDGIIVEIGSFLGRSTHYLGTSLMNAGKEDVKIYCVDTFEGSSEHANIKLPKDFSSIFRENLKFFIGRDMVRLCQGRSDDIGILEKFQEATVDYVLVDGAHEYDAVKEDIINWWPKLKPNGVMFGDDYSLASVSQAVQDGFGAIQVEAYGANKGFEQTWYSAKNGENKQFEKLIPGVNTYT
jgi:predicted O-methyltransferase YrrM